MSNQKEDRKGKTSDKCDSNESEEDGEEHEGEFHGIRLSSYYFREKNLSFSLPRRYKLFPKPVGIGTYGTVFPATDQIVQSTKEVWEENEKHKYFVGIKIVKIPLTKGRGFVEMMLRELETLVHLRGHPNVINIRDVYFTSSKRESDIFEKNKISYFDTIAIITDLGTKSLDRLIQKKSPLPLNDIQKHAFEILQGLEFIHKSGIIHRDLKP